MVLLREARSFSCLTGVLLLAIALAPGCSSDTRGVGEATSGSDADVEVESDAACCEPGSDMSASTSQIVDVVIEPDTVELVSTNGAEVVQEFEVRVSRDDGTAGSYSGLIDWTFDTPTIGRIGERNGEFQANGVVGGTGEVTATLMDSGLSATAEVRVVLERSFIHSDAPQDAPTLFTGQPVSDEARAATVVYPLEGAVMPQNVFPADIQWLNGVETDLFRVTLSKPDATAELFVAHTGAGFGNHLLVEDASWRALAQTNPTDPMTIEVDRWEAASQEVISSPPVTMRFADAALSGSVYYWDIAAGRIVRINDGSGTREEFMPTPPQSPSGEQCIGCHTVSNDGRYMVGRLGGGYNAGAIFDLTNDLTQNPPPTEYAVSASTPYWNFATWSPDNSRLVVTGNEWAMEGMKLVDPFAGQVVPVAAGSLPGSGSTHPAWSPDGTLLAYVENAGGFGGANTTGDIAMMPVTGNDEFGAPNVIQAGSAIPNAQPAGNAASYPTWTPDSQWVAFAHGSGSRSEDQQSALYMIQPDGTGLVRLDNASGGPDAADTFQPNFSPFHQGGYFWVSYLTRRDYGNSEVGTRGSGLQQIWVSAIRDSPDGSDPSEVGYWLPGQNTQSRNISGYWAPRACRMDGEGCTVASECCSGECLPDDTGTLVCSPPPPDRCREIGESCSQTSDCCEGSGTILCQANTCTQIFN